MDCSELLKKYPTSLDFSVILNKLVDSRGKINFFGGDSSGNFEEKSTYEHVSNSERLPIYIFWNLAFPVRPSVSSDSLDFCFCRWLNRQVYKRNVDTRDELLARILDDAAHIDRRADQLRRNIHDLRTQVAQSIMADSGIFEHLF